VFFKSVFGLQTGKIEALILEQNPTKTLVGFFYARISNDGRRGSGILTRFVEHASQLEATSTKKPSQKMRVHH
jgi:hypothetical protein